MAMESAGPPSIRGAAGAILAAIEAEKAPGFHYRLSMFASAGARAEAGVRYACSSGKRNVSPSTPPASGAE